MTKVHPSTCVNFIARHMMTGFQLTNTYRPSWPGKGRTMSDETMPEWEFFLTTQQAIALRDAGQRLLIQWQRNTGTPTKAMLKAQKELSDSLAAFVPQVNEVLFGGVE